MSTESEFKEFLDKFVNDYLSIPVDERLAPFRLVEDSLTTEELPGHCCEWSAQYLYAQRCPVHWVNIVCKEVEKIVAAVDLTEYNRPSSTTSENDSTTNTQIYLDASRLCQLTFRTLEQLVAKWNTEIPEQWKDVCSNHPHTISHFAIKNTRRKMEDRHCIVPSMSLFTDNEEYRNSSLYAVFDGHGGMDASYYTVAQFLQNLVKEPGKDKSKALYDAFSKTDLGFSAKAARENLHSGTTALAIMVDPDALYISWLGDSQAILVKSGRVEEVMDPHKPEREDEKARIEGLGGCVIWFGTWRVNGNLAVSRAIGDVDHRPYISSEADTNKIPLAGNEEYIVLACDGLWDTVSPDKVVELVYEHIEEGKPHSGVAEMLVRAARQEGSGDNITVIAVFFKQQVSKPNPVVLSESEDIEMESKDDGDGDDQVNEQNDNSDESKLQEPNDNLNSGEVSNQCQPLCTVTPAAQSLNSLLPRVSYPTIELSGSPDLNTHYGQSSPDTHLVLPTMSVDRKLLPIDRVDNGKATPTTTIDGTNRGLSPLPPTSRPKSSSPRAARRYGMSASPRAYLVFDPIIQPKPPLKPPNLSQPSGKNKKHRKLVNSFTSRKCSIDGTLRGTSLYGSQDLSPRSSRGPSPALSDTELPGRLDQSPYRKLSSVRRNSVQTQLRHLTVTQRVTNVTASRKASLPILNKDSISLSKLPPIDDKNAFKREYTSEYEE